MATVGPAVSLPRELVDMILSHIEDDVDALKACRLAGITWLVMHMAATSHLFRKVFVLTTKRGRSIDAFIKFVNATPHIATCIRGICLVGSVENSILRRTIDATLVYRLLQALPNLDTLTLDRLQYGPSRGWPAESSRFRLEKFVISNCPMITRSAYKTCLEIMSLFSDIHDLCMYVPDWPASLPAITLPNPPPKIERLAIEEAKHQMLPFLRDGLRLTPDAVHLLSRKCTWQETIDSLGKMVAEYGQHLKTLHIDISDLESNVSTTLLRSHLANKLRALKSIVLTIRDRKFHEDWSVAMNILAAVPDTIEDVTIVYSLPYYDPSWKVDTMAEGLAQLDDTLRKFTRLKNLYMSWTGYNRRGRWCLWYGNEKIWQWIVEAFSSSPIQRLLRFGYNLHVDQMQQIPAARLISLL